MNIRPGIGDVADSSKEDKGLEARVGVGVLVTVKKVRKVKEEIVNLFPRPVFNSNSPP